MGGELARPARLHLRYGADQQYTGRLVGDDLAGRSRRHSHVVRRGGERTSKMRTVLARANGRNK